MRNILCDGSCFFSIGRIVAIPFDLRIWIRLSADLYADQPEANHKLFHPVSSGSPNKQASPQDDESKAAEQNVAARVADRIEAIGHS
ncbi:hypothetical protein [Actinoallomurus iriomotensis]|uniref:Uncharacterized protein n=1 Tax=Actinoallomurus iriomotensis TaxID=478107 RepID=A0A9W6VVV3_9ACTN|nr:hypothetical protein [Actinoallomurus iriomotensis]GLY81579.1 hypothetical protein Airi01_098460 [Actinoallomurus iriomotensis]